MSKLKLKFFRFNVKSNFRSENTWEPRVHFEKCKYVLEEFDKSYSKSKIASKLSQRAADARAEQQKVEQTRGRCSYN